MSRSKEEETGAPAETIGITVLPPKEKKDTKGVDLKNKWGFYSAVNARPYQEDALRIAVLPEAIRSMDPYVIAQCTWTGHSIIDKEYLLDETNRKLEHEASKNVSPFKNAGTTASTVIYNGNQHLIVANLADASSFAIIYKKDGTLARVIRLNSVTHTLKDPMEASRIRSEGGFVIYGRAMGVLAVSRAIGDAGCKEGWVCAQPRIDVFSLDELAQLAGFESYADVGEMKIFSVSDGYTDNAKEQTLESHEAYTEESIKAIPDYATLTNEALVEKLVTNAPLKHDNTTGAMITIKLGEPELVGVYDGHGGDAASSYVATHIVEVLCKQLAKSKEDYEKQADSVINKAPQYERDTVAVARKNIIPQASSSSSSSVPSSEPLLKSDDAIIPLPQDTPSSTAPVKENAHFEPPIEGSSLSPSHSVGPINVIVRDEGGDYSFFFDKDVTFKKIKENFCNFAEIQNPEQYSIIYNGAPCADNDTVPSDTSKLLVSIKIIEASSENEASKAPSIAEEVAPSETPVDKSNHVSSPSVGTINVTVTRKGGEFSYEVFTINKDATFKDIKKIYSQLAGIENPEECSIIYRGTPCHDNDKVPSNRTEMLVYMQVPVLEASSRSRASKAPNIAGNANGLFNQAVPNKEYKGTLNKEQLEKITSAINTLKEEINSWIPYFDKDRKAVKLEALKTLVEKTKTVSISDAIADVKKTYESKGLLAGEWSTRTRDLLKELEQQDQSNSSKSSPK